MMSKLIRNIILFTFISLQQFTVAYAADSLFYSKTQIKFGDDYVDLYQSSREINYTKESKTQVFQEMMSHLEAEAERRNLQTHKGGLPLLLLHGTILSWNGKQAIPSEGGNWGPGVYACLTPDALGHSLMGNNGSTMKLIQKCVISRTPIVASDSFVHVLGIKDPQKCYGEDLTKPLMAVATDIGQQNDPFFTRNETLHVTRTPEDFYVFRNPCELEIAWSYRMPWKTTEREDFSQIPDLNTFRSLSLIKIVDFDD